MDSNRLTLRGAQTWVGNVVNGLAPLAAVTTSVIVALQKGQWSDVARQGWPMEEPAPDLACLPQAWAATTPVMLIRSPLRHDAHFALGELWMDPVLPEIWGNFHAENVAFGEASFSFDVFGSQMKVEGLPEGTVLHRGIRPTLADVQERARPRLME